MFQALKELKAAPGRTAMITVTVTLIAVLVTFLSSLTSGLGYQSVSALKQLAGDRNLVLADTGTPTLAASQLTPAQAKQAENEGGELFYSFRTRVGDDPVMVMSDAAVAPGTALTHLDAQNIQAGNTQLTVQRNDTELFSDHQPVVLVNPADAAKAAQPNGAWLAGGAAPIEHTQVLSGSERWKASASYAGEQMSLTMMVVMLYAISALVLGAFFMVWTMQRLRGVAISSALGASGKVLAADAIGQALLVMLTGIIVGTLITVAAATAAGGAMPVVISAGTTLRPGLILLAAGLAGAALSLRPVFKVSPRTALANA